MDVTTALTTALAEAKGRYDNIDDAWRMASYRYGSKLPQSLMVVTIQRLGKLDLIIRCLEDEFRIDYPDYEAGEISALFTEQWLSSVYEVMRVLKARQIETSAAFFELFGEFELLRVTLDKYEIKGDRKLTQPLNLVKTGGNAPDVPYVYDPKDPAKAHIMPMGMSARGSLMWQVIDLKSMKQRWLERRALSDWLLSIAADPAAQAPTV